MIFLDTTFLIGSLDESDDYHSTSVPVISDIFHGKLGKAIVTDFIINEVSSILNSRPKITYSQIKEAVEILLASPHVEIIYIDETLLKEALEVFGQYKGDLSLTDSMSVHIMQKYHIKEIYSHDSDFDRVAGIKRKIS